MICKFCGVELADGTDVCPECGGVLSEFDTVVLEISYNTMAVDQKDSTSSGDQLTIARFDTLGERMKFLFQYVSLEEWVNIYSRDIQSGVYYWLSWIRGKTGNNTDYANKGYQSHTTVNCELSPNEAVANYNLELIPAPSEYFQSSIKDIVESIELCKSKNIKVIITVTPVADSFIWCRDGWDEFLQWTKDFATEQGCDFYDFNLIKSRYDVFSDSETFYDETHLSATGSELFSNIFCEVVLKVQAGEDVSSYFFESYRELKKASPYAKYLS